MTPVVEKYRKQLVDEGVIDEPWVVAKETEYEARCDEAHKLGSQAEHTGYIPPKVRQSLLLLHRYNLLPVLLDILCY